MIKDIKRDLIELRGATVDIFGQSQVLPARSEDDITVDILELVDALGDCEITNNRVCALLEVESVDDIENLDYKHADNSYNWGGMISNDFDYRIYTPAQGEGIVLAVKFHRFGDVRGNYTDTAYCLLNDEHELHEIFNEQFHDFYIIVESMEFSCTSRINDEYIRCSAKTNTGYIDLDVVGYDKSDVLAELVKEFEEVA